MKYYLGLVCFTPILMVPLFFYSFLGSGKVPSWFDSAWTIISVNFWIGLVVIVIDLWRQKVSREKKIMWTVLNLFMVFALPLYWYFRFFKFGSDSKKDEL